MIDEELIERGKALKRLKDNEDFSVLLVKWSEHISKYRDWALNWEDSLEHPPFIAAQSRHKFQALHDLMYWIDEEIESAGNELVKKSQLEAEESEK